MNLIPPFPMHLYLVPDSDNIMVALRPFETKIMHSQSYHRVPS